MSVCLNQSAWQMVDIAWNPPPHIPFQHWNWCGCIWQLFNKSELLLQALFFPFFTICHFSCVQTIATQWMPSRTYFFTVPSSVTFWNSYKYYGLQMWSDELLLFISYLSRPLLHYMIATQQLAPYKSPLCASWSEQHELAESRENKQWLKKVEYLESSGSS